MSIIFSFQKIIPGNIKKGYMCKQSGEYGRTWHSKPYRDIEKAMKACVMNNECVGVGNFGCNNRTYWLCKSVYKSNLSHCVHQKDGISIH